MSGIRMDGKVAVITGATGGWGSGAAVALARRGAAVVLNARTQDRLDAFAARLAAEGCRALSVALDSRTLEGATELIARAVEAFGRVDSLVNCAGVTYSDGAAPAAGEVQSSMPLYGGTILDLTEDSWNHVLQAELSAVFNCHKAAATRMVAQGDGGSITTVVGSILGAPGQSAHAVAKAGVLNGIWSWSEELRQFGITVNGVRGYVRSLLTDPGFDVLTHDFDTPRRTDELPTEPIEAGELVAWLASEEANGVTGAYLGIDGPRVTVWEPTLPSTTVFRYPSWTAEAMVSDLAPIVLRRPARPTMTDVVIDMFSGRDRQRADAEKRRFATDGERS